MTDAKIEEILATTPRSDGIFLDFSVNVHDKVSVERVSAILELLLPPKVGKEERERILLSIQNYHPTYPLQGIWETRP